MAFCNKCGAPLDDGDLFCASCGATVTPQRSFIDVEKINDEWKTDPNGDPGKGADTGSGGDKGKKPPYKGIIIALAAVIAVLLVVILVVCLKRSSAPDDTHTQIEAPAMTAVPEAVAVEPTPAPTVEPTPEPTPAPTPVPDPDGYLWDVSSVVTIYDSTNHSTKYESGYSNPDGTYCSHEATQYYAVYNVTEGADGYIYFTFAPDSTIVYHTLPINYYMYRPVDGPSH